MNEELASENKARLNVQKIQEESSVKLDKMKKEKKKWENRVCFKKRNLNLLEFDLNDTLYNQSINRWPVALWKLFEHHFKEMVPDIKPVDFEDSEQPKTEEELESISIKQELMR